MVALGTVASVPVTVGANVGNVGSDVAVGTFVGTVGGSVGNVGNVC